MQSIFTDFGMKRSASQALGFYVVHLLISVLLLLSLNALFLSILDVVGDQAFFLAMIVGCVYCVMITLLVLRDKHMLKKGVYLLFIPAAFGLGLMGMLLGMLPAAFLTTHEALEEIEEV
jgi:vacuolar-type H+-ATPase subunit I/STV1